MQFGKRFKFQRPIKAFHVVAVGALVVLVGVLAVMARSVRLYTFMFYAVLNARYIERGGLWELFRFTRTSEFAAVVGLNDFRNIAVIAYHPFEEIRKTAKTFVGSA